MNFSEKHGLLRIPLVVSAGTCMHDKCDTECHALLSWLWLYSKWIWSEVGQIDMGIPDMFTTSHKNSNELSYKKTDGTKFSYFAMASYFALMSYFTMVSYFALMKNVYLMSYFTIWIVIWSLVTSWCTRASNNEAVVAIAKPLHYPSDMKLVRCRLYLCCCIYVNKSLINDLKLGSSWIDIYTGLKFTWTD